MLHVYRANRFWLQTLMLIGGLKVYPKLKDVTASVRVGVQLACSEDFNLGGFGFLPHSLSLEISC
jgi:hypothetical protein